MTIEFVLQGSFSEELPVTSTIVLSVQLQLQSCAPPKQGRLGNCTKNPIIRNMPKSDVCKIDDTGHADKSEAADTAKRLPRWFMFHIKNTTFFQREPLALVRSHAITQNNWKLHAAQRWHPLVPDLLRTNANIGWVSFDHARTDIARKVNNQISRGIGRDTSYFSLTLQRPRQARSIVLRHPRLSYGTLASVTAASSLLRQVPSAIQKLLASSNPTMGVIPILTLFLAKLSGREEEEIQGLLPIWPWKYHIFYPPHPPIGMKNSMKSIQGGNIKWQDRWNDRRDSRNLSIYGELVSCDVRQCQRQAQGSASGPWYLAVAKPHLWKFGCYF